MPLVYGMIVFMKSLPPLSCTTTSTGALALKAIVSFLLGISRELVLFRGHNQLQQATHAHGTRLTFFGCTETPLTTILSIAQQRLACLIADSQRPHQIQTVVHHRF